MLVIYQMLQSPFTHSSSRPHLLSQVIPIRDIDTFCNQIEEQLQLLYLDYFEDLDWQTFVQTKLHPNSPVLMILQHRVFFDSYFLDLLLSNDLERLLTEHFGSPPRFFNMPSLHYTPPGVDTPSAQLQRDYYPDVNQITCWIPLVDINPETGGLVWATAPLDPSNPKLETAHCSRGDLYIFGPELLHGSIHPKSKNRITLDLRFCSKQNSANSLVLDLKQVHSVLRYQSHYALREILYDPAFIKRNRSSNNKSAISTSFRIDR